MREFEVPERLRTCYRCKTTNTKRLALSSSDDESSLVFCGWCNVCDKPFSYRLRVDIVWDQEGRI